MFVVQHVDGNIFVQRSELEPDAMSTPRFGRFQDMVSVYQVVDGSLGGLLLKVTDVVGKLWHYLPSWPSQLSND